MNDLNQFKNNGFLVKKNLITQKEINKINKVVNEVISKEKVRKVERKKFGKHKARRSPQFSKR